MGINRRENGNSFKRMTEDHDHSEEYAPYKKGTKHYPIKSLPPGYFETLIPVDNDSTPHWYDPVSGKWFDNHSPHKRGAGGGLGGFGGIVGSLLGAGIGSLVPGIGTTLGASLGGALGGGASGGGIKGAITGGLSGYGIGTGLGALGSAAGAMGANLAPGAFGPVTSLAGGANVFKNALLGGTGLLNGSGSLLNSVGGIGGVNNLIGLAGGLGAFGGQPSPPSAGKAQSPTPSQPLTRPAAINAPASLSALATFDPTQTRSALATQGVNQGLGSEEDAYYRNLVQRSLIGDDNKITDNPNSLLPIESQYFSRQGMDTSSTENFLRQIRGY